MIPYNPKDKYSIEKYASLLEGKSLSSVSDSYIRENDLSGKGSFGQIIERDYFGYDINSMKQADFLEAGVELKTSPVKRIKRQKSSGFLSKQHGLTVKERMVLTIIDYKKIINENWENNSLMNKAGSLLIMFYLYDLNREYYDYEFLLNRLWEPSGQDLIVIEEDWRFIKEKIKNGHAHELSEGDTMLLGACTKGANKNNLRVQPASNMMAMQRAFSYKRSYVDRIFNDLYSRVSGIQSAKLENSVYDAIIKEFSKFEGLSIQEIMSSTGIRLERKSKSYLSIFTNEVFKFRIGISTREFNETNDAGVEIKNILLKTDNIPKESMSFEQIQYNEIVNESWFTSEFRNKFEEKKMLWVVYKASTDYSRQSDLMDSEIRFVKAFFWNMPINDLDLDLRHLWEDTVEKIKRLDFEHFLGSKDNRVGHVRPKARDSNDKYELITGELVPKKSFWLNNTYVASQIKVKLNCLGKYLY